MANSAITPERVFEEYERGARYKNGLGKRGLYEQNRINERFYAGDQWRGANCGDERPLVRYNVIKRIGEYKIAAVGSTPVGVRYLAEGVPDTLATRQKTEQMRQRIAAGDADTLGDLPREEEIAAVTQAMSDYYKITGARVGLEDCKERVLRNAYLTGTGILYTYWDEGVATGQFADRDRAQPIRGDIACEVLDVENVTFGDPAVEEIQRQPYLLIAQRRPVSSLRALARRYGRTAAQQALIRPDDEPVYGDDPVQEGGRKATLLTRFWKRENPDGSVTVKGIQVCRGVVVRPEWDLGIRLYPLANFAWDRRRGCAYGDSEITWLIPNQIAINRMMTASVWAVMMMGMPIMVVNGDVVNQPVTNDPGQIIPVYGSPEEVEKAIHYVAPPAFSAQYDELCSSLIVNTLNQAGVNSAVLGDMTPDNTSAILAVRQAAMMPLTMISQRFYRFIEDVARIFAEFWVTQYGCRRLKMEDSRGVWYLPFDADRYRDLVLSVQVQVGASSLWSENQTLQTLDNLFARQVIDSRQYLERLPDGAVPDLAGLKREFKTADQPPEKGDTPDASDREGTAD